MKKLLLFFIAGLLFRISSAAAAPVDAIFQASYPDKILLVLNNQRMNEVPAKRIMIKGRSEVHRVQIRVYNQWGRLKFVQYDKIIFRPKSHNQFIPETHSVGGSRLKIINQKKENNHKKSGLRKAKSFYHPARRFYYSENINEEPVKKVEKFNFQKVVILLKKEAILHREQDKALEPNRV